MNKNKRSIAFAFVLILQSLYADSIPFRVFSVNSRLDDWVYFSNEKRVEISVPSHRRSGIYKYEGEREIHFYSKKTKLFSEKIRPVVTASIPKNCKNPLILFLSNETKTQFKVFVFNDGLDQLKIGSGRFVNLSDQALILVLGDSLDEKIKIDAYKDHFMYFDQKSVNVRIRMANVIDDKMNKAMDSRIFPLSTHRDLYFIYPVEGKRKGLVRLKILREHGLTAQRILSGG
jgi:hypothetical protein